MRACYLVFKYNRLERIDAIVIFISNIYLFLPFFFISKVIKSKYFIEVNEFPLIQNKNTYFNSKLLRPCYNLFDGIFVISYKLREYFQNELKINSKVIHLPMTVDLDRFSSSNSTINFENWVTYVGDPTGNKDGVSILISAFSIIANEYPSYKLIIIGAPSKSNDVITILKSHAKSLHLEDKIVFTGHLSNEEVVKYLVKSKILALARPSNYQNEGGFPTKLGEYLASGRPVVLTDVGDISKYLIDRVSAFIAKPNNIESFAIKLKEALQNDKFSDFIGNNGKQIAITYFNFITQGRTIISTINSYY
jgi:glycosyltransferase involved in cell wall biosynthesis